MDADGAVRYSQHHPIRAWYLVLLMATSYGVGELSHFMVGITSRAMSQELHYGDQSCLRSSFYDSENENVTCADQPDNDT